jgi:hypothetical protein
MEKTVKTQIMNYLVASKLIAPEQHGFVNKKACNTNLLETLDYATKTIADNDALDILFLDFAKAFDKVPHKRLLLKLAGYGIQGKLLNWIRAFLANRRQRVVLGEQSSDWSEVKSGVPQGSVLGPILFILYINDLPEILANKCKMYADDTKIIARLKSASYDSDSSKLQDDINAIVDWTNTWLMKLNIDKCKVMHIGKRNRKVTYTMGDHDSDNSSILQSTDCERDLGVLISSDLKPSNQVNKAASKANSILGMLKRTFTNRDKETWSKLYKSYVRPHIEFAVPAWSPYTKKDINTLEKVQDRATKTIHSIRHLPYHTRCAHLQLSPLTVRRLRGDLIQQFKISTSVDEVNWHNSPLVSEARGGHRKHLRREIVRCCNQRHEFFTNRIANNWNALEDEIVYSKTVNQFKNKLDKRLNAATGHQLRLVRSA